MLNPIDGQVILVKALQRDANGFFHNEKQYEYVEWQSNSSHCDFNLTSDITQKLTKKLFKETAGYFKKVLLTNKAWDIPHPLGERNSYGKTDSNACISLNNLRCYMKGY